MARPRTYRIRRPDQLEALASPVRMEILSAVESFGTCTAAELSELLGRAQSSLYFHLGLLADVELLESEETDAGTRYRTPSPSMRLPDDTSDPETSRLLQRTISAILRGAERATNRAIESASARLSGARRDTFILSRRARLSPRALREVNECVDRIEAIYEKATGSSEGTLHTLTLTMAPAQAKKQKRT